MNIEQTLEALDATVYVLENYDIAGRKAEIDFELANKLKSLRDALPSLSADAETLRAMKARGPAAEVGAEQVQRLKAEIAALTHDNEELVKAANSEAAENEALRVDAERYRWLRNSALVYLWEGHDDSGWTPSCGADVDLAADEARPETIAKERQS